MAVVVGNAATPFGALVACVVACLAAPGCARETDQSVIRSVGSARAPLQTPAIAFPLAVSSNHRSLVDRNGAPVLLLGEGSAQTLALRTPAVVSDYLDDRAANGFNALWVHVIINDRNGGNRKGLTDDGIAPFTATLDGGTCDTGPCYDLSTPNPAYFTRLDRILNIAAEHGMAVFLDTFENDSYLETFRRNGSPKVILWARYLAERYQKQPNIVWMTGNDFQTWRSSTADNQLALDIMSTLAANDSTHLQTTELNYNISGSLDDTLLVPHTSLAGAYTYYPAYYEVLQQYNSPIRTVPVYLIETYYEAAVYGNLRRQSANDLMLRKVPYWTVLSGGLGGYFYGSVWYSFPRDWRKSIDSPAVAQLAHWKALFLGLPWYDLVPDQTHGIVTAGYGTATGNGSGDIHTDNYVTAAATPDGKLVVAYAPATTTMTVDMTRLAGATAAQWFDPSRGTYTTVTGSPFPNTGMRDFRPPGRNGAGDPDWVLILRAESP